MFVISCLGYEQHSAPELQCIWNDSFAFDSVITFLIKASCLYKDILLKQDKLLHHRENSLVIIMLIYNKFQTTACGLCVI